MDANYEPPVLPYLQRFYGNREQEENCHQGELIKANFRGQCCDNTVTLLSPRFLSSFIVFSFKLKLHQKTSWTLKLGCL